MDETTVICNPEEYTADETRVFTWLNNAWADGNTRVKLVCKPQQRDLRVHVRAWVAKHVAYGLTCEDSKTSTAELLHVWRATGRRAPFVEVVVEIAAPTQVPGIRRRRGWTTLQKIGKEG
jgi:hypothetical protein